MSLGYIFCVTTAGVTLPTHEAIARNVDRSDRVNLANDSGGAGAYHVRNYVGEGEILATIAVDAEVNVVTS